MIKENKKKRGLNTTIILLFILFALFILFTLLDRNFIAYQNILQVFNNLSYVAIIAAPLTMIFILGEIDISFGAVMALSSMLVGNLYKAGVDIRIAIVVAIIAGAAVGAVNGFFVAKIGINSIIVTLGTMLIGTGAAYMLSEGLGRSIPVYDNTIGMLGRGGIKLFTASSGKTFYMPWPIIMVIVIYVFFWFVLKKTSLGQHIYAIGQNRRAAHFMGLKSSNIIMIAFILTGLYSSFGGLLITSLSGAALPQHGSFNMLLTTLAGIMLGGAKLGGGKGDIFGTLVGVSIISFIYNGLALRSLQSHVILIFTGVLFLIILSGYEIRERILKSK